MRPTSRSSSTSPSRPASPGVLSALRQSIGRPAPSPAGTAPQAPGTARSAATPRSASGGHAQPVLAVFATDGELLSIQQDRQELLCSVIGLMVKLGLIAVAGVSLMRVAGAYQQRMERQGEITAVLELETAKLTRARQRFDNLFQTDGEQRLIREQSQWIAPNRMRVVWQDGASRAVETADAGTGVRPARP